MKNAPIVDKLLSLKKQNIVSFHVPGHKNGKVYNEISYESFKKFLCNIDTTEIPGTDNLHNAKDIIKESQEKASRVFKSEESFFLINGSTSGIYSMIMSCCLPKDKVLIDRHCHQSVINATILGDLTPVYIYPSINKEQGIAMGICPEEIEKKLVEHRDIKAVVITYPTYYGIACDLKKIAEIVHKYDKILLVDEAHGAHFGLSKDLPPSALSCGADAVVQSTHKTLTSFTQSSMLHIQGNRIDREKLKFMLRIHQSSSPSYLLLSSLDLAVMIYENEGKYLMKDLLENVKWFRQEVSNIKEINILGDEIIGLHNVKAIDTTRLWFGINHMTGYELEKKLRDKFNLQMELSNFFGTLAVTSIANEKADFYELLNGLVTIVKKNINKESKDLISFNYEGPKQALTPREAFYKDKKRILLKESEGYISGEYIIPYPPGIPIVIPGEVISEEVIVYITKMVNEGMEVLGLRDNTCQWIDII